MAQDQDSRSRFERRSQLKRDAARALRANATDAERKLWSRLRRKQMGHLRFRRQHPVGPFIVDFYCSAARLAIELDGSQHGTDEAVAYDCARTLWLNAAGYRVLRFDNIYLLKNLDAVLEEIWQATRPSP